jgi:hypothetical protein
VDPRLLNRSEPIQTLASHNQNGLINNAHSCRMELRIPITGDNVRWIVKDKFYAGGVA